MKKHIINVSPQKALAIIVLLDDFVIVDSLDGYNIGDIIEFTFDEKTKVYGVYQITSFDKWLGIDVLRFKQVSL